jgi:predicted nucleotidyltransferase component of viral defense system
MKLHLSGELFKGLILQAQAASGLSADILEKDYYVTLVLSELAAKQGEVKAYFKGGTALYKAIGRIKRFSEDIDLTVNVDGLTNNQARKRLEASVYGYSLSLNKQDEAFSERKGSITAVYDYQSAFYSDSREELQRFEKVLVEATSFTISEPIARYTIAPLVYDLTTEANKAILRERFDVASFGVETIRLERIFVDKVFAAEFYFRRQSWFDVAKHVYDLTVLSGLDAIKALFTDKESLLHLISLKRREEAIRKGGIPAELEIGNFGYFDGLSANADFRAAYQNMQSKYVLNKADEIPFADALKAVSALKTKVNSGT